MSLQVFFFCFLCFFFRFLPTLGLNANMKLLPDLSVIKKCILNKFIFLLMSPFASKHLYFAVNTHFSPSNQFLLQKELISVLHFFYISDPQSEKWVVNSASFWHWDLHTFHAHFTDLLLHFELDFLHSLPFISLVIFSKHVWPYTVCVILSWHLLAWMESTNRKLSQLHLPNTCALMPNLQSYFGLHE